ncbi:hypothetical protein TNCV_1250001 [Trichonephila clavipes]|nr:hypothetical protein TNCV_1250001 [Trichonephila clavipes]
MILADQRVTIDSIVTAIESSSGLEYIIMHDCLNVQKICSRWVPRQLTEENKKELNEHLLSSVCSTETTSWRPTFFILHEVLMWMRQQPKEFYVAKIRALINP